MERAMLSRHVSLGSGLRLPRKPSASLLENLGDDASGNNPPRRRHRTMNIEAELLETIPLTLDSDDNGSGNNNAGGGSGGGGGGSQGGQEGGGSAAAAAGGLGAISASAKLSYASIVAATTSAPNVPPPAVTVTTAAVVDTPPATTATAAATTTATNTTAAGGGGGGGGGGKQKQKQQKQQQQQQQKQQQQQQQQQQQSKNNKEQQQQQHPPKQQQQQQQQQRPQQQQQQQQHPPQQQQPPAAQQQQQQQKASPAKQQVILDKPIHIEKLFLQIGSEVKKTQFHAEANPLQVLQREFMERYQFEVPANEKFPAIYMREADSTVFFELEDCKDLEEKCVVRLEVSEQDDPRQKYSSMKPSTMKELMKEMNFIKTTLLRQKEEEEETKLNKLKSEAMKDISKKQAAERTARAQHLKGLISSQTQKVGQLRSELNSLRKATEKFVSIQHGDMEIILGQLRKAILDMPKEKSAQSDVAISALISVEEAKRLKARDELTLRSLLDADMQIVRARSSAIEPRMDALTSSLQKIKEDLTKKKVNPSARTVKQLEDEADSLSGEIETFRDMFLKDSKQRWKKTWEVELQLIIKEQNYFKQQEELSQDFEDDFADFMDAFQAIKDIVELKKTQGPVPINFVPPPIPDDVLDAGQDPVHAARGFLLNQLAALPVNSDQRMKALMEAEKLRKASSLEENDFEMELKAFVGAGKLKSSGGGVAALERQRRDKEKEVLRAMFESGNPSS